MDLLRSIGIVALSFASASLVACSAATDDASTSDSAIVADDDGKPEPQQPACIDGTKFGFPGFEDDLAPIGSATAKHSRAGESLEAAGFDGADPAKHKLTVIARGSGRLEGNFQYVSRADYRVCGKKIVVARDAHVEFLGGGLTAEQMAGCAQDITRAECYVLAAYCEARTLSIPQGAPPRCVLKSGIAIAATLHGEQQ